MYTLSNQQFKGKVPQIDPNAFVTIFDANQILGKGFKRLDAE